MALNWSYFQFENMIKKQAIYIYMPNRNGTGPMGEGPMTGRGLGPCGRGQRTGRTDRRPRLGRRLGRGFGRRLLDEKDQQDQNE